MLRFLFFISLSLLTLITAHAVELSSIENKINQIIVQHREEQLALLEKIVNINSGTKNIPGVLKVGIILRAQFSQLGFKTKWVDEPASMQRAPTFIAERNGTKGKRVLLIGHLDTVFPKNSPFQKFQRIGNRALGPGVIDDKGGDIVILYALKALYEAHALENTTIIVVLTGDEEDSGKPASISRKPLFQTAKHSDIALDFEWAISANTATVARRGISNWLLKAVGQEGHSSQIFHSPAGYGAIFEISRILDEMRQELAQEQYLSFNPGLIIGGSNINYEKKYSKGATFGEENVIAKCALVKGDLRFLSAEQKSNAEKKILMITRHHLPYTSASIIFQDGIPAMPATPNNLALLGEYSRASRDLGYGIIQPLDPGSRGAGDISHIASIVAANLAGLGALGEGAHSTKETLSVDSLTIQTQRAALLIYRLTNNKLTELK